MSRVQRLLHLQGLHRKWVFFRVNKQLSGTNPQKFEKKRKLLNKLPDFDIGTGTKIVGPIEVTGKLITGANCWIGKNLRINGNGTVTIGDNVDIGPEVTFQTGGHEIGDRNRRAGIGIIFNQSVGSGTWIGGRATVLNNTSIGTGCVVAGCSCVTKDVPDNSITGGVPARVIREINDEGI